MKLIFTVFEKSKYSAIADENDKTPSGIDAVINREN